MGTAQYFQHAAADAPYAVFPLGGIGAGSIGIGADGRLQEWEIFNRPAKGSVNGFSHFAIRAERDGEVLDTRVLNGPFAGNRSGEIVGKPFNTFGFGPRREYMTGFPHFERSSLTGPYPVANLAFEDHRFPGSVEMQALSPFIPLDARASSLPVAQFEVRLSNTGATALDYTFFGCVSFDFANARIEVDQADGLSIVGKAACDPQSVDYAEVALATDHPDVSYQRHLYRGTWFDMMEVYWADISRGGRLTDRFYEKAANPAISQSWRADAEHSVMAAHVRVGAGETKTLRLAIGWYVPNVKKTWVSRFDVLKENQNVRPVWKNYYATQWTGAADVLAETFERWDDLVARTLEFRECLAASTLPLPVLDAVSANLSVIKSPTALRLEDGAFYGWEGCHPEAGCCEGSCTHVWNYQQVLPFLFPELERSLRESEFFENQVPETGGLGFRLALPKGIGVSAERPCADGHFGAVIKTYRDWKLSGDTDWLRRLWPHVAAAVEFAWHAGNYDKWDPSQSGVLTGRQHHTLDMELFGPNAWLNGFYLGALLAGAEMADALGDSDRADLYREIFERGKAWTAENLFNGSYFIQKIDVTDKSVLDEFNFAEGMTSYVGGSTYDQYWSDEHGEIKYQIADGCEIDQVLAQWHANLYGLGEIFDAGQFASAVRSIYAHNFATRLGDEANPCRVFGMAEESGTLMCAWPAQAARPAIPVPYSQETMHGFEYAFGSQLMMIGEIEKGIEVFAAVRDRYRGHNRNPWNEIECGSNYARSMSSYAALLVLSGFGFEAVRGEMSFDPMVQSQGVFEGFWCNANAWGTIRIGHGSARLEVRGGTLRLSALSICGLTYAAAELADQDDAQAGVRNVAFPAGATVSFADEKLDLTGRQPINM